MYPFWWYFHLRIIRARDVTDDDDAAAAAAYMWISIWNDLLLTSSTVSRFHSVQYIIIGYMPDSRTLLIMICKHRKLIIMLWQLGKLNLYMHSPSRSGKPGGWHGNDIKKITTHCSLPLSLSLPIFPLLSLPHFVHLLALQLHSPLPWNVNVITSTSCSQHCGKKVNETST